jgi:hypothetical protein
VERATAAEREAAGRIGHGLLKSSHFSHRSLSASAVDMDMDVEASIALLELTSVSM